MIGFGMILVVIGVVFFILAHTEMLKSDGDMPLRVISLVIVALGTMMALGSLYLNYTPWFYVFALVKGTALVGLSYYLENKKLLWPGVGLLAAGFLMVIVKPGWFLVVLLVALVVLAHHLYLTDANTKAAINSLIKEKN